MKIAIVWYGRMWVLVEKYAEDKWHEVVIIIDPEKWTKKEDLIWVNFDIIIEFSVPKIAMENMVFYAENNMKVIMATTGWYDRLDEVKNMFEKSSWALLWSWNFSLWVNLYWNMIENASKLMNKFTDYDVFGHEFHHNKKADSPSGTLLNTAKIVVNNIDRKTKIVTSELSTRAIKPEELHFSSTRGGSIPWIHSVYFDSPFDTIEITHSARSRDWFAVGSIVCAEWLKNKTGYFEIKDFMKEII